jgi:hypothetical protein
MRTSFTMVSVCREGDGGRGRVRGRRGARDDAGGRVRSARASPASGAIHDAPGVSTHAPGEERADALGLRETVGAWRRAPAPPFFPPRLRSQPQLRASTSRWMALVGFSPRGDAFASVAADGHVRVWDTVSRAARSRRRAVAHRTAAPLL